MVGGSRIMEIYVLDPNTLDRLATIDVYESFIWNTSYNNIGNFELHCSMKFFKILQTERVIQNTDDDKHNGLIETVYKVTKDDGSETLAIKGRMIEAGTHEELLQKKGHYYQLYSMQFLQEKEGVLQNDRAGA